MNRTILRRASLAATLGMTSHAEISAGIAGGMPMWHPLGADLPGIGLPWLLPIAIDCYVVDALENGHGFDRWAALSVLTVSVVGGSVAVADTTVQGGILAGIGTVLVGVLSRLYAKPRPSKTQLTEQAATAAREQAEADRRAAREREAVDLRVEEAERLAAIEARREQDAVNAHAARMNAQVEADKARLEAESAAEVARIHAEAEAAAANRDQDPSANPRTGRPRTPRKVTRKAPAKASASTAPPARDEAVRKVADAIREHVGDEPYDFDWQAWADQHGGGKTFWWGVHKAATQPVHLAEVAS